MCFTPGILRISWIASASMRSDSSRLMFGARSMLGEIVPSLNSGMKEVPRNGNSASDPANSRMAAAVVDFGRRIARLAMAR